MEHPTAPHGTHLPPDPGRRPPAPVAASSVPAPPLDDTAGAGLARALAHPVRVRILRIMAEHDECFCGDLCEVFQLAQSTISQHLKVLRDAGLIRGTRCGTAVGYRVDESRLAAFHGWAGGLAVGGALPGFSLRPEPEPET